MIHVSTIAKGGGAEFSVLKCTAFEGGGGKNVVRGRRGGGANFECAGFSDFHAPTCK